MTTFPTEEGKDVTCECLYVMWNCMVDLTRPDSSYPRGGATKMPYAPCCQEFGLSCLLLEGSEVWLKKNWSLRRFHHPNSHKEMPGRRMHEQNEGTTQFKGCMCFLCVCVIWIEKSEIHGNIKEAPSRTLIHWEEKSMWVPTSYLCVCEISLSKMSA